jgi:D-lactate dehydrogenase (cytochrome)
VHLKGTISAEHGIGKMKREYLLLMYGEGVIRQMARLKLVFDPNKILNIGNIFEEKYLRC